MILHHLSENNSVLNHFLSQIRDIEIQNDRLRFRKNIERIGEIIAYEMSKEFSFQPHNTQTPLGAKDTFLIENNIVVCSILRAGLALHTGFLNFFDEAENGFISAYRHHFNDDNALEIRVEYKATPSFLDKNLILVDPMLATGESIFAVYSKILQDQKPKEVHIAVVIAAPEGIAFLEKNLPENCHLWIASIDEKLNSKNYIIPGLGDAGDLAFGEKL
jgi:uracil phosphoribosyltransferase